MCNAMRTGQVLGSWTRPNELSLTAPRERMACPAALLAKEISVGLNSAFASGLNPRRSRYGGCHFGLEKGCRLVREIMPY